MYIKQNQGLKSKWNFGVWSDKVSRIQIPPHPQRVCWPSPNILCLTECQEQVLFPAVPHRLVRWHPGFQEVRGERSGSSLPRDSTPLSEGGHYS